MVLKIKMIRVDNDESTRMVAKTTMMTTMTTTTVMTTRMTMIEEGTHLRLKTEHTALNSDILAWRDGRTYGWTDGRTYGRTDTASYRVAMDASKNKLRVMLKKQNDVIGSFRSARL